MKKRKTLSQKTDIENLEWLQGKLEAIKEVMLLAGGNRYDDFFYAKKTFDKVIDKYKKEMENREGLK